MKGHMGTQYGTVVVDPEVIAQYAGARAVACFGIVGMASVNMREGLVRLVNKNRITSGIKVTISDDNKITIDFHVIVVYGVNISAVADTLISDVKYSVEEFCNMEVQQINVFVEGVRSID